MAWNWWTNLTDLTIEKNHWINMIDDKFMIANYEGLTPKTPAAASAPDSDRHHQLVYERRPRMHPLTGRWAKPIATAMTTAIIAAFAVCGGAGTATAVEADLIEANPEKINIDSCQDSKITLEVDASGYTGYDYGVKVGNNCLNDNPDESEGKPECLPGAATCCEVLELGTVSQSSFTVTRDQDNEDLLISRFIDCDSETTGKLTFTVVFKTILGTSAYSTVNVDFVLTRPLPPELDGTPVAGETSVEVKWTADSANQEFKACAIDSSVPLDIEVPFSDQSFENSAVICSSLTTENSANINNLEVDKTYQITVIGYDEAGNESLPAIPVNVTTQPVTDFFEYYKETGGAEMGGYCSAAPISGSSNGGAPLRMGGLFLVAVFAAGALITGRRGRMRHRNNRDVSRKSGSNAAAGLLAAMLVIMAALTIFLATPGTAQAESPRYGVVDIRIGSYTPDIDSEFGGSGATPGPYERYFGNSGMTMFSMDTGFHIFQTLGTITAGMGIGYGSKEADGFIEGTNTRSPETTKLSIMPLNVYLAYSLDFPATLWNFPLVPYAKLGLDYHIWRVLNGSGDVTGVGKAKASGGIPGYHYAIGLRLLLDTFASSMARNFDNEFGINNTYVTAEYLNTVVDGFGDHKGLNLSSSSFLFGMAFDF